MCLRVPGSMENPAILINIEHDRHGNGNIRYIELVSAPAQFLPNMFVHTITDN